MASNRTVGTFLNVLPKVSAHTHCIILQEGTFDLVGCRHVLTLDLSRGACTRLMKIIKRCLLEGQPKKHQSCN